ncbi:heparan-alpha-glucosaminide N-acetyltransferase [uncultured Jannaschia sp.]|uniref:heparan-alpha-glucosaminide N-acetyltransferase n=1 Tax=uncultured Jannaschia sp. TaxID=293347 RepID=UPI00261C773D|nr:heparan-alpha-glucosaminide N-acetyltransferase [uncultured Jannaschia sp.]
MSAAPPSGRLIAVDWLRSLAIVAMAAFHFGRDFEVLGLVPPGTTFGELWNLSARAIASTFVFLAGFSLWLAHGRAFRRRSYLVRLAQVAGAAAAISLATRIAVPEAWVRFGILHSIALSSVLALPFLRVPAWGTALAALLVLFALPSLRGPAFDGTFWLWSGLGTGVPPMMDYEPMVPWLAPFLAGLAFGQAGGVALFRWGPARPGRVARALAWPGRHALPIYLVHQPALIAVIVAGAWLWQRM